MSNRNKLKLGEKQNLQLKSSETEFSNDAHIQPQVTRSIISHALISPQSPGTNSLKSVPISEMGLAQQLPVIHPNPTVGPFHVLPPQGVSKTGFSSSILGGHNPGTNINLSGSSGRSVQPVGSGSIVAVNASHIVAGRRTVALTNLAYGRTSTDGHRTQVVGSNLPGVLTTGQGLGGPAGYLGVEVRSTAGGPGPPLLAGGKLEVPLVFPIVTKTQIKVNTSFEII